MRMAVGQSPSSPIQMCYLLFAEHPCNYNNSTTLPGLVTPPSLPTSHLMQVFKRQNDLPTVKPHLVFGEVVPLVQVGEQLPTAHVVWKGRGRQKG